MRASYFLPAGFIKRKFDKKDHESDGLFSLDKLFKKMFTRYKVAHEDDCCPLPTTSLTDLPVRFNAVANQLQRYNPVTDTWVAVV